LEHGHATTELLPNQFSLNTLETMTFNIHQAIEILERTPLTIETLLKGISKDWVMNNEGEQTWSPYEVVGHLIHGEKTDWIPRVKIILSEAEPKTFTPFNRFAHMTEEQKPMQALLEEFKTRREDNLEELKSLPINDSTLLEKGMHPEFGEVTLRALLSTWVVHDLSHIAQISRVMAKQYDDEVGAWKAYLSILNK
jgi:hypothetical protein